MTGKGTMEKKLANFPRMEGNLEGIRDQGARLYVRKGYIFLREKKLRLF